MSFSQFKTNRKSRIEKLQKQLEQTSNSGDVRDERFWKPTLNKKEGVGYAVIRFLPGLNPEESPWVKLYEHAFQGNNDSWYIENCPTSINRPCPVCVANKNLWNTGTEENRKVASDRKRKTQYICNIYVVSDPAHPENEGKVFLYKFGTKIFEKIQTALKPEFADDEAIDPFDPYNGADFKLKINKNGRYWSYEKSGFSSTGVLEGFDDNQLDQVYNKQYDLNEFVDVSKFKPYEELEERFNRVSGVVTQPVTESKPVRPIVKADEEDVEFKPSRFTQTQSVTTDTEEDDDDPLAYFKSLVDED